MDKDSESKDEFELELTDEDSNPPSLQVELKNLKTKLKEANTKATEYLTGWQRAKADYLNLQREEIKARENLVVWATRPILLELIGLADIFDLAFVDQKSWQNLPANWRQGVEHIHKELLAILARQAVEVIDPQGEKFDPIKHHSVGTLKTDDPAADDRIIAVLKKGYTWSGEILRPAQVKVGTLSN